MGTAIRGRSRASASAAVRGFKCPGGNLGPQPATGSSATSRSSAIERHAGEEIGVAGEVRGCRAGDEITERRRLDAERPPPAVVLGVRGANRDAAYLLFVTGPDLDDVVEAAPSQQGAGSARHDESWGTSEQPERREIEVVVVDMRDEHHIEPMLVEPESGADALQVEHPRA